MFKMWNRKKESEWVYEAVDMKRNVIGSFPSPAMAERRLKECGGGTIRPRKVSAEEGREVAKKARKSRGRVLIPPKAEKPVIRKAEGIPVKRIPGKLIREMAELYCAIGGNIPLMQNPMIVIDPAHISAYKTDNPFGLEIFAGDRISKALKCSEGMRKVIDSADLKRAARNMSAKKTYDLILEDSALVFTDGNERYYLPISEDRIGSDPFKLDMWIYVWVTGKAFYDRVKAIPKGCEYLCLGVEKDGFVHMWTEFDGEKENDVAIGLADGDVRMFTSRYPTPFVKNIASMFRKCKDVKIEFMEDYPARFVFENERRFEAMVAPRLESNW